MTGVTEAPEQSLEEILSDLNDYMDMFATAGWALFIEVTSKQLESDLENAYLTHRTGDEWQNLRGHIALAKRIIGFENLVRAQIDQINEAITAEEEEAISESDDGEEIAL